MQFLLSSAQHIGARSEQQDSYAILESGDKDFRSHAGVLVVVADGMGGLAHGALASQAATSQFVEAYREKTPAESVPEALLRSVESANAAVHRMALEKNAAGDMGTTLVAGAFLNSQLYWISVGDSGIFLHSTGGEMKPLNTPHTLGAFLAQQAAKGVVDPEIAKSHPDREALTSFLGLERISQIDRNEAPLMLDSADIVLFASDGLFKFLPGRDIVAGLSGDVASVAARLVEKTVALRHAQQDNVTVVCVTCGFPAKQISGKLASVALLTGLLGAGWLANRFLRKRKGPPPAGDGPVSGER